MLFRAFPTFAPMRLRIPHVQIVHHILFSSGDAQPYKLIAVKLTFASPESFHILQKGASSQLFSTLNVVFRVKYSLELRNAVSIYYAFHILLTNVKLVVWTL